MQDLKLAARVHFADTSMRINKLLITIALFIAPLGISATHVDLGVAVGTPPPPPPAPVAVTPAIPAPGPGYIWVPAHWDWVDGRWVWLDGRWMLPPRPHAVWIAPRVEYRLHRGHWR